MQWTAPTTGKENVRYWLLTDILRAVELRPLYPQKRTFRTMIRAFKKPLEPDDGNGNKCDECNSPILLTFNYDSHLALPDF